MSRGRRAAFTAIAVLAGVAVGLAVAEYGLRTYVGHVQSQERMDPGFLIYDAELGWKMARDWRGHHHHYDFDVVYTTNGMGLRGLWPEPGNDSALITSRRVLLGDSFTFGLGVNDDETFASLMNADDRQTRYLNAGVAGYSTDQEYLYLKAHLGEWQPDRVTLVVYLANDLLDNTLAYPLQADMAKPFFSLTANGLQEENAPMPRQPKPPAERQRTLATMVLGEDGARALGNSWLARSQIARSLGLTDRATPAETAGMGARLAAPVDLFVRLVRQMGALCATNGVALDIALMPGRSFVEQPGTISAVYQDYLRAAIIKRQADLGVPVIDLATPLRERAANGAHDLYHPNEGHLTAEGHKVVAELLGAAFGAGE